MKNSKRTTMKRSKTYEKRSKKDFPISKETKERVEAAKAYIESKLIFSVFLNYLDRY